MNDLLYVQAPSLELTADQERGFAAQWEALTVGEEYHTPWPKHVFLRWLVATQPVLLHGSNDPSVDVFQPRERFDYNDNPVCAVFATSDGLWPIYFAISDRRVVRSLINDCVHEDGAARYFFSVGTEPADAYPRTRGTIYVLPRSSFTAGHGRIEWLSFAHVRSLARLSIDPDEFPFLDAVFRHERRESEADVVARLRAELAC